MKKIINGKKYDTATAEFLASWWNGLASNDFAHCSEELYRKRTGEFFLYGEGGPMTEYRRTIGQNEWSGGEDITPLTEAEARKWVEEKANDRYEEIFGEVEE